MAYTGGVGTYLKAADITEVLAADFMAVAGADLGIYFDYADAAIVSLAMSQGVPAASIALNSDGTPKDANLKEYGLSMLYVKLFRDKTLKQNSPDSNNLSNSVDYDKYQRAMKVFQDSEAYHAAKVTYSTITNTVSVAQQQVRSYEFRRG